MRSRLRVPSRLQIAPKTCKSDLGQGWTMLVGRACALVFGSLFLDGRREGYQGRDEEQAVEDNEQGPPAIEPGQRIT